MKKKERKVYEDEANNKIFFDIRKYMKNLTNSVIDQDAEASYYIQREISIHRLWDYHEGEVLEILKKNPEVTEIFKVEKIKDRGHLTTYVQFRGEAEVSTGYDRIFIKKMEVVK